MKKLHSQSGFTLIELILYMGLLSIFLVVLTDLLIQTLDVRTKSTAVTYVDSDAQYIQNRLQYDLRRASAVTSPATVGATASTLTMTIAGLSYSVASQSGNLVLTHAGVSQALNTSDTRLVSFSVTRIGNGTGNDTYQITTSLASVAILRGIPADSKTTVFTIGTR